MLTAGKNIIEATLTLLLLLLVYFRFDIVYDSSYASFCNNQVVGQFSDFSLMDQYYLAWVGVNEAYKFLHNTWPVINWTGIAFLLFNALGLYVLLVSIKKLLKQNKVSSGLIFLFQIIITLVYADNIMSITHTRFSILFCGVSLLSFGLFKQIRTSSYFLYLILFVLGMLHRPEAALGMFIFIIPILLIIQGGNLLLHYKRFIPPLAAMLLLYTAFAYDWHHTELYERKLEPNIEYALTTKRVLPLSEMQSKKDSLRHTMALNGLLIDESFVNISFLRQLTSVEWRFQAKPFVEGVLSVGFYYTHFLYFPVLLIGLLIYGAIKSVNALVLCKILALSLFSFIYMCAIAYSSDIYARHISGILLLNTVVVIYLMASHLKINIMMAGLYSIMLLTATITISNYKTTYNAVKQGVLCHNAIMQNIEKSFQNKYIIVTLKNYHLFDRLFTLKNNIYNKNTYLMYDILYYSKVPPYNDYLSAICHCNPKNPIEFFTWLEKEQAIYIADNKRFTLLKEYVEEVYNKTLITENTNYNAFFTCSESESPLEFSLRTLKIK